MHTCSSTYFCSTKISIEGIAVLNTTGSVSHSSLHAQKYPILFFCAKFRVFLQPLILCLHLYLLLYLFILLTSPLAVF